MNMNEVMMNGIMFMVVGMGVVFSFLVLMVVVMNVAGGILKNFPDEEPKPARASKPKPSADGADDEVALAIAIAKAQVK